MPRDPADPTRSRDKPATRTTSPQRRRDNDDPSRIGPGTRIGGYFVRDVLSAGGFGTVYRVEHEVLGRPAALKVLHAELSASDEVVARFQREAQAVNRISHPNVVDIYDIRTLPDGRPYLVMELLEGRDLDVLLREKVRLDPEEILEILEPLCSALAAAHAEGIIHRDLKASNVFLDERGPRQRVVLLDFGIAKLLDPSTTDLTTSRHAVGTPASMAPEQILGGEVDARTDVYALGSLVFHMLTGTLPFADPSVTMMQHMHLHARRPQPSQRINASPGFDALIARAMDKSPERRFPDVSSFLAAFRAAAQPEPRTPGGTPRVARRRALAIHIELHIPAADMEEPDDALLEDIDSVLARAASWHSDHGFRPAMESGVSALYICELPVDGEPVARRAGIDAARQLWRELRARPSLDRRVHVNVCLAVGDVVISSDRLRGGDLLRAGSWVPSAAIDGLVGAPEVFEGLDLDLEPIADDQVRVREPQTSS